MAHDFVAKFGGNLGLQPLDFLRTELDNLAGLDVDEMIMMLAVGMFKPSAAIIECVALDGTPFLQDAHRAIHSRERNRRIDSESEVEDFVGVRWLLVSAKTRRIARRCFVILTPAARKCVS